MKEQQKQHLIDIMKADEELGLYDLKQTAVEWFAKRIKSDTIFNFEKVLKQAKEMEKQQQDNFAIGFAEWLLAKELGYVIFQIKDGILETYKKEKGL